MAIKLNTGKVAFTIEFDNGDKGCIYFNPNDPDLATRLIASRERISKRIEDMKLEDISLDNSGDPIVIETLKDIQGVAPDDLSPFINNAEKLSKIVSDTRKVICEEIDIAFDGSVSDVIFKYCSPFAVIDGTYFAVLAIDAIAQEVQKHIEKTNKATNQKTQKYIGKYVK